MIAKGRIMTIIGIVGGNSDETANLFLRMYQEKETAPLLNSYNMTEDNGISLVCIDENQEILPCKNLFDKFDKVNVWLIQEVLPTWQPNENSCLIINADADHVFAHRGAISYGFNGKASVTASSVADGAMQVCVQRGFKTLGGKVFEPQEFKASCPPDVSPINVLGAVTACAVCDNMF